MGVNEIVWQFTLENTLRLIIQVSFRRMTKMRLLHRTRGQDSSARHDKRQGMRIRVHAPRFVHYFCVAMAYYQTSA